MTLSQRAVEAALTAWHSHEDPTSRGQRSAMEAALSAALAVDGVCLVPRKLTPDMIVQGYEHVNRDLCEGKGDALDKLWSAMLAAASTGDSPRQEKI